MGLLDNRMIDYFDSETKAKVPKQSWMKDRLEADYWVRGTQSRQSKQQWFEVNINILKDRMRQNDSDLHVLQWMVGCEGEMQEDGWIKFYRGIHTYSYDGNDFLSFDDAHSVWVAPVEAAEETKRKWDDDPVLKDYTKGYLENECMQWLNKYWIYGMKQLQTASPPEVFVFARDTNVESNIRLTCLATGFYPQDIIMWIKRDGRKVCRADELQSSGVRPNEDDTFQRRDSVEILRKDKSRYTCEVIHEASSVNVTKEWENSGSGSGFEGPIIGGTIGMIVVVVLVTVVLVVLYFTGIIGKSIVCGAIGWLLVLVLLIPVVLMVRENPGSGSLGPTIGEVVVVFLVLFVVGLVLCLVAKLLFLVAKRLFLVAKRLWFLCKTCFIGCRRMGSRGNSNNRNSNNRNSNSVPLTVRPVIPVRRPILETNRRGWSPAAEWQ